MALSDFERGVNWGKFTVSMWDIDMKSEDALRAVMEVVVAHLQNQPDPVLIDKMTDAWFSTLCHGRRGVGEVCNECGVITARSET